MSVVATGRVLIQVTGRMVTTDGISVADALSTFPFIDLVLSDGTTYPGVKICGGETGTVGTSTSANLDLNEVDALVTKLVLIGIRNTGTVDLKVTGVASGLALFTGADQGFTLIPGEFAIFGCTSAYRTLTSSTDLIKLTNASASVVASYTFILLGSTA